jgi:hypothetical protein
MKHKISNLLEHGSKNNLNKKVWLGEAEKIAFHHLQPCAQFVTPFSINNPDGWRYWLMHFANSYRARQVFNNVLHHDDTSTQAHYGRSGLYMLAYDPSEEQQLYLFNSDSRTAAKSELHDDIPRVISNSGDVLKVDDFYKLAYNQTAAHSDDINEMIIHNPDIIVQTEGGGERRKPNTISITDTLRLKKQQSMFFMYNLHHKEK